MSHLPISMVLIPILPLITSHRFSLQWYFDADTQMLYVLPNGTDLSTAEIAIPLADQIITINGSVAGGYASNITFTGFTFTQSRVTFLEQYEVPSGGGWEWREVVPHVPARCGTAARSS